MELKFNYSCHRQYIKENSPASSLKLFGSISYSLLRTDSLYGGDYVGEVSNISNGTAFLLQSLMQASLLKYRESALLFYHFSFFILFAIYLQNFTI